MFYELIYTRCRNGIDILSGKPITSEGYKVYACSPELLAQSGFVDAELLLNAAQAFWIKNSAPSPPPPTNSSGRNAPFKAFTATIFRATAC